MSRIGNLPIPIPAGVEVQIDSGVVRVKGPKGELEQRVHPAMRFERENGTLLVRRPSDERQFRALHGLTRTLVANMVHGVTEGYRKDLEIHGVGYRAQLEGKTLVLSLGFSHPVRIDPPEGITFVLESPTRIGVQGIDKQLVGEIAARIRRVRPPEPYKGKGVRYLGERVRRKAGKAGKVGK
ncbi:50S ribosomal protein L6 [Sphaerobacter thermophilus]|jgi:large subunit ribosomal protein L6|uniref:50S ribosomal protein L6 n=1 Tax=Sphaerobacter thermophilus TaxID=2057 RepID=UPI000DAF9982|nr:MAG: 50S ribosomal protein L6 [Sphaerobacter thermophilus]